MTAVGLPVELAQREPDVKRRRGLLPVRADALDCPDYLSVKPDAAVEREVTAVGLAEPDRALTTGGECSENLTGRIDGVARQAEGAGEHVAAAAWQRGEGRQFGRGREVLVRRGGTI